MVEIYSAARHLFKIKRICRILVFGMLLACVSTVQASKIRVVYPDREGIDDSHTYPFALLNLALEKSRADYRLIPSSLPMNDARIRAELARKRLSIAWFGTSMEFEQKYMAVRFPITLGILGHRLLVIHQKNQERFSKIKTIRDLSRLSAGQGMGWADIKILECAGLKVETDMMDTLFMMINRDKFIDYFPLGANEVFGFVADKKPKFPNLAVEKHLVLVYPFDFFFFVHRDNHALHDIVFQGLLTAYQDGSFEQLFTSHPDHRGFLNRAELKRRHRISIDNPLLSEETNQLLKQYSYTR